MSGKKASPAVSTLKLTADINRRARALGLTYGKYVAVGMPVVPEYLLEKERARERSSEKARRILSRKGLERTKK